MLRCRISLCLCVNSVEKKLLYHDTCCTILSWLWEKIWLRLQVSIFKNGMYQETLSRLISFSASSSLYHFHTIQQGIFLHVVQIHQSWSFSKKRCLVSKLLCKTMLALASFSRQMVQSGWILLTFLFQLKLLTRFPVLSMVAHLHCRLFLSLSTRTVIRYIPLHPLQCHSVEWVNGVVFYDRSL